MSERERVRVRDRETKRLQLYVRKVRRKRVEIFFSSWQIIIIFNKLDHVPFLIIIYLCILSIYAFHISVAIGVIELFLRAILLKAKKS